MPDGLVPVDFVVATVHVLNGEEHEVTVFLIISDERQHDVQIGVGALSLSFSCTSDVLIEDCFAGRIGLVEHHQGTIHPYREFVDELPIFPVKHLLALRSQHLFWCDRFPIWSLHSCQNLLLDFRVIPQQHLRQDEDTVVQLWVIEIAHILHAHFLIYILQYVDVFQDVLHLGAFVLMFLK